MAEPETTAGKPTMAKDRKSHSMEEIREIMLKEEREDRMKEPPTLDFDVDYMNVQELCVRAGVHIVRAKKW